MGRGCVRKSIKFITSNLLSIWENWQFIILYSVDGEKFSFFPCVVKAFARLCDVDMIKQVCGHVLKLGGLNNVYAGNSLLSVYWKCGTDEDAVQMFEQMCEMDLVSWGAMIYVFFQSGDYIGSLVTYCTMIGEYGVYPNRGYLTLLALSACSFFFFFFLNVIFYICNNASFNKIENIQRSKAHRQCTMDRNNKTSKLRCMESTTIKQISQKIESKNNRSICTLA